MKHFLVGCGLLIFFSSSCVMAKDEKFRGYCEAIHVYKDGHSLFVHLKSYIDLTWFLPQKESSGLNVATIQYKNLMIKNLAHDNWIASTVNSKKIPVRSIRLPGTTKNTLGASWMYGLPGKDERYGTSDGKTGNVSGLSTYVDFLIKGEVFCYDAEGEIVYKRKFNSLQKRDYKVKHYGFLDKTPDNWAPSEARITIEEGNPVVKIFDTDYSQKHGIFSIERWGTLDVENGEIVFNESEGKRKVYYSITVNEEYKWVDGKFKRVWDKENRYLNAKKYPYKTIYEWGYDPSRVKPNKPVPENLTPEEKKYREWRKKLSSNLDEQ